MRRSQGSRRSESGGRSKFVYKKRTEEQIAKRASVGGGFGDSFLKKEFALFRPKQGVNKLRILPPTWEEANHWGIDVFVHYGVGPDNSAFLCLNRMNKGECPMCEERLEAESEGDIDYSKELRPVRRVLIWLIDRKNEEAGPILWASPQKLDKDLFNMSIESSEGLLFIDDPQEGYDIEFNYLPPANKKPGNYEALRIARRSTVLGNDEWVAFAVENPLPTTLNFYEFDYISKLFAGKAPGKAKDLDLPSHTSTHNSSDKVERKQAAPSKNKEFDDCTYESVHNLNGSELDDYAEKLNLSIDDSMSDSDVADNICEALNLFNDIQVSEENKEKAPASDNSAGTPQVRERLRKLRSRTK